MGMFLMQQGFVTDNKENAAGFRGRGGGAVWLGTVRARPTAGLRGVVGTAQ